MSKLNGLYFLLLITATGFFVAVLAFAQPLSLEKKQQLEQELKKIEQEIAQTEGVISQYQQQSKTLQREINLLNSEIKKINLQIRVIDLTLDELRSEIAANKKQVEETQEKLERQKESLRRSLQAIYEKENQTIIEILLKSPSLSYFFSDINGLLEIQNNLRSTLKQTIALQEELLDEREQLALKKSDQQSLREYQAAQKRKVELKKAEKDKLLRLTKGQESKYQELLKEKRKTAAQIRNRIFELLGGGRLTFEQAYKLAKSASDLTGVKASLILAVLDRESALGYNVGRCNYREAMHPVRDLPVFLELTKKLGINPNSVLVSCPISYDGAYGGAMGPAQFIPSTWKIYEERIAQLTGSHPPSPWRNLDAFVATALYLKDALNSRACVNYANEYKHLVSAEILQNRCAAAKYYAGSNWWRHRFSYGDRVLEQARQFERDIQRISAS